MQAMWAWASGVFGPVRAARRAGVWPEPQPEGTLPLVHGRPGLGRAFADSDPRPRLLAQASAHAPLVEEFDRMAEIYDAFVKPFSQPIFDEALPVIDAYLQPDARVLDAGCGAGRELQRIARRVPAGEVVGIDLSAGMVNAAWRSARAHGLGNCAFVQSDVGALPPDFTGRFDLVYSSLAHHHYPEPRAATLEILRALRPGGVYCVVDPGPEWFNAMSAPLAQWADPGWIGFHSPAQFRQLFLDAGFERAAWHPLLPGFGVALGQKRL